MESTIFDRLKDLYNKSQTLIIVFLLGLLLMLLGLLLFKIGIFSKDSEIEVLNSTTESQSSIAEVTVEIAGSVVNPGVYKLSANSRIADLLTVSGGLSADADRKWVEKNINRASKLTDGQKIYIYSQSEVSSAKVGDNINPYQDVLSSNTGGLVNINTATLEMLDKLPGIGPVYGQKIIEQRPYSTSDDLLKKGVLPESTFKKIKDLITVY